MTPDELFTIPEQPLSELAQARNAFAKAQAEYDALDESCDDLGIGEEVLSRALRQESRRLLLAERAEVERKKQ